MSLCIRVSLHIYVTIHCLFHTCMSLYIRSIHMYYSTYESLYIYGTLHTLFHTYMPLYIRSIHICYSAYESLYIYVTIHSLFHTYMSLYICSIHMLLSSSKPLQIYTLLFGGFSSSEYILHFTTRSVPIPCANLNHHRVQKFAITTITDVGPNKHIRETNTIFVLFDVFLFYHRERCEKVDHVHHHGFERM